MSGTRQAQVPLSPPATTIDDGLDPASLLRLQHGRTMKRHFEDCTRKLRERSSCRIEVAKLKLNECRGQLKGADLAIAEATAHHETTTKKYEEALEKKIMYMMPGSSQNSSELEKLIKTTLPPLEWEQLESKRQLQSKQMEAALIREKVATAVKHLEHEQAANVSRHWFVNQIETYGKSLLTPAQSTQDSVQEGEESRRSTSRSSEDDVESQPNKKRRLEDPEDVASSQTSDDTQTPEQSQ